MNMRRFLTAVAGLVTLFATACFADRVVGPANPIPALIAIDRPMVQLFRFARGRSVVADTVRITNNGEGPLGLVDQVGGVDYLTTARTGWLNVSVVNQGAEGALLILRPTYAEDEQDAADVAEVVLGAAGSLELKRVTVIARTLRGASFEFSVSPLAFARAPGDPASSQVITVRNGGNGTLEIRPPTVRFEGADDGWLSVTNIGSSTTAPDYQVEANPGSLGGGLFRAFLDFESPPNEETRAKPASLEVLLNIGQPQLGASTTTQAFTVIRGEEDPPAQTVLLSNVGAGAFGSLGTLQIGTVTYGPGATDWIEASLSGNQVQVGVLTEDLPAGDYTASFPVESVNGGAETIQVALSVEAPIFTPSTTAVSFGMVAGDAILPAPAIVRITNTGSGEVPSLGDITLKAFAPAATWITASLGEEEIILTPGAPARNLAVGTYTTMLPVETAFGGSANLTITLSVSPGQDQAAITLSATALEFTGVLGNQNPPQQTVQISNAGGGALGALSLGPIAYTGPQGWLTATLADSTVTLSVVIGALPAGSHIATVPVVSVSGGTDSIQVTVNVGSPILTASATSASFSALEGGGNPTGTTISFSNTGPGTFATLGIVSGGAVSYSGPGGWLSASYAGGVLTLSVTTGGLVAGTYGATVPVNSTNGGSVTIDVSFTVIRNTDAALLVASPATIRMDAVRGGPNPPDQTVLLSNGGGGTLGALGVGTIAYGSGSGWLGASLAGSTVTLSGTTGSLTAGTYTATVQLTSANGGNDVVAVTFVVAAPTLTLSAASASFSGEEGGSISPASVTIDLSNTGAGDFSSLGAISLGTTVYGSGAGWVTSSLGGGNTSVDLSVAFGALGPGTHTATVPVNSADGGNKSIAVTFTVSPAPADPTLVLSSTSAMFFAEEGSGDPAPQMISVSNAGGGGTGALGALTLGTTVYGSGSGWLAASLVGATVTLSPVTGALTAAGGPYTATVPVQSVNGGNQDISVTFTVSPVPGPADLEVSPSSVRMDAVVGGSNPADQEVLLYNGGGSPLGGLSVVGITYGSGAGWLSESLGGSTLTLSGNVSGLTAGTYTASVEVSSSNGGNETVAVTFEVSGASLVLSAVAATFSAVEAGGDPASQDISISNEGGGGIPALGTLSLGTIVYGSGAGWLTASLVGTVVTLSPVTGALTAAGGPYTATVPVESVNGGNQDISVTFNVVSAGAAADLEISPTTVRMDAVVGGSNPTDQGVLLYNGGDLPLGALSVVGITYGSGSGWLSESLVGSTLTLSGDVSGLSAGTYTASVDVSSANGGNETVGVTFEVSQPTLVLSATSATFFADEGGGDPASQDISISNGGGGEIGDLGVLSLGATVYGTGSGWLTASRVGTVVTLSPVTGALTAAGGPYTATVPVQSVNGGNQNISVTFNVVSSGAAADLEVSPATVRMDALVGGANPADQEVLLYNGGSKPLGGLSVVGITYGSGAGWLSESLAGSTLTLSGDVSGLTAGTYTASVDVSSSNGGNETVAVTFEVSGPALTLSSTSASFAGPEGGAASPGSVTIDVSNTGAGVFASLGTVTLGATTYGSTGGWLTAAQAGGTTQVDLSATMGALGDGVYTATVPVNSTAGGSADISVTFTVSRGSDQPTLSLSASAVEFTSVLSGSSPPDKIVSLSNSGGGTVGDLGTLGLGTITYGGGSSGWLSTSSLVGSTLTLSPITGALPTGTHTATVPVQSQFGGNQSISVTLEVGAPVLTASTLGLSFTGLEGGANPPGQPVTFSNTGAGDLSNLGTVSVGTVSYTGASGWLNAPSSGATVVAGSQTFSVDQSGLPAGSYTATVPVSSQNGGAVTVTVALSVVRETDDPILVLSATTQRFDALFGGGNPDPQSILVSNGGGGTLGNIQAGPPSYGPGATGWLNHTLSGLTLTVSVAAAGLGEGTYTATLPVGSTAGGTRSLVVTLVVGSPRLTLAPRALSFGDSVGGTGPDPLAVAIANTGGGTFASLGPVEVGTISYEGGAADWLEVIHPTPETLSVRAITGTLQSQATPYTARVLVSSTLGGADTVVVSFTVTAGGLAPDLSLSVDSMTFPGVLGGGDPSPQIVSGQNSGGGSVGTLTVAQILYLDQAQDWLSGSVAGSLITLQATITGIPSGTNRAMVIVESERGGADTLVAVLRLAQPILNLSSQTVTFSDTVGSPAPLQSQVFISNSGVGAGDQSNLGLLELGDITYSQGESGWLQTIPLPGTAIGSGGLTLSAVATGLSEGTSVALVPVLSEWGGTETVAVTFVTRIPDRSFDLPTIEFVMAGSPLEGDSIVVGVPAGDTAQVGVRVGVRNASDTRVTLSGLRVGIPTYPVGQSTGWITGAFLDRTSVTFSEPAELFVAVSPGGLPNGRHEGRLVVSSQSAGLEAVAPRVLRVILNVG